MTFGTNRHLRDVDIQRIYSEFTGLPCGRVIRHGDGRQDVVLKTETIRTKFEELEDVFKMHPNDVRRLIFEKHREAGMSEEQALAKLFPERKVTV